MDDVKSFDLQSRQWAVEAAFSQMFPRPYVEPVAVPMDDGPWVVATFDDYIIVYDSGKYYKAPYSATGSSVTISDRSQWTEAAQQTEWVDVVKSIKKGSRNNRNDQMRLQQIHDFAVENGALCGKRKDIDIEELDADKTMIAYGGEVKTLGDTPQGIRVGGYLVRFSSEDDPDLTGDYFTKDTDFGLEPGEVQTLPVFFHHGMPLDTRDGKRVTITDRIGKSTIQMDDVGLLIDAITYNREEYQRAISSMVKKMGWSSGAVSHLVEREEGKKANRITRWIIGEASLTPTPAEPRNSALPLKSLIPAEAAPQVDDGSTAQADAVEETVLSNPITNEVKTMEIEEIKTLVSEAAKAAVEEYRKSEPAEVKAGIAVTKDEADQPFEHPGKFFQAVKAAALYPQAEDPRLRPLKATGMSEGVPADGGYLLPNQTASGILENMFSTGEILSRLPIDPVTGNAITYNGVDETSRATGSRKGGIQGYWLAEGGTFTASKPKFRQIELKLKKVGALCYATEEQLEDTANLESWLTRTVPEELRFLAEDAIYEGDGVGKPLGIMNSPALLTVTRDTGGSVLFADIVNMWARRYAGVKDYVWFVNQDVMPELDQIVLANSSEAPTRFMSYGPEGALTIKGKPVIEVEYASTLNTTGDIMLASMSQYQAISKGGIKAATSIHVAFTTAEQAFRFVYRIDGQPTWNSPVTPFKGTNTVSPFVVLSSAT